MPTPSNRLPAALMSGLALAGFAMVPAAAAQVQADATFKDWAVYTAETGGETACYAATRATDKAPKSAEHGDVVFYVTYWKGGRRNVQSSLKVGYELRKDMVAEASVAGSSYRLFTVDNEAFARDEDEAGMVAALRRGSDLRVDAVSARDTKVAYQFSLSGSGNAIERAEAACR